MRIGNVLSSGNDGTAFDYNLFPTAHLKFQFQFVVKLKPVFFSLSLSVLDEAHMPFLADIFTGRPEFAFPSGLH
jgi:hypothetical protein